jgi:hypothetical protein
MTQPRPTELDSAYAPGSHASTNPPAKAMLSFDDEHWVLVRHRKGDGAATMAEMLWLLAYVRRVAGNERTLLYAAGEPVGVPRWCRRQVLTATASVLAVLDRCAWRLALYRFRLLGLIALSG